MFFFKRKFGWEKHFVGFICFAHVNERHLCLLVCDTFWNMLVVFVWPPFNSFIFNIYFLSLSLLFVSHKGGDGHIRHYHVLAFGVKRWQNTVKKSLYDNWTTQWFLTLCFKASLMATWKLHAQWNEC